MLRSLYLAALALVLYPYAAGWLDSADDDTGLPAQVAARAPGEVRTALTQGLKLLPELQTSFHRCDEGVKFIEKKLKDARRRGRRDVAAGQEQDLRALQAKRTRLSEEWHALKDAVAQLQCQFVISLDSGSDTRTREALAEVERRLETGRDVLRRDFAAARN